MAKDRLVVTDCLVKDKLPHPFNPLRGMGIRFVLFGLVAKSKQHKSHALYNTASSG